mgnify:CR=1 FL=1
MMDTELFGVTVLEYIGYLASLMVLLSFTMKAAHPHDIGTIVDQDGIAKDANASTLHTQLGYKTGKIHDFSATLEIENVTYLGNDNFNNTINNHNLVGKKP